MILFIVDNPVSIVRNGLRQQFVPQVAYVTSAYDCRELQQQFDTSGTHTRLLVLDEVNLMGDIDGPCEFGASNRAEYARRREPEKHGGPESEPWCSLTQQITKLSGKAKLCVAVINGFGTGIGDTVVGLSAWRIALQRLAQQGHPRIVAEMWLRPLAMRRLLPVYQGEPTIDRVCGLPVDFEDFSQLDGFWDLSSLLERPYFKRLPLVDFFLYTLGVDPAAVAPQEKRNRIALDQTAAHAVRLEIGRTGRPFVLLHPKSSSQLRDMPDEVLREIFQGLVHRCDYDVASVVKLSISHQRYRDLSTLSASYQNLCAIVAHARGLLSVDTSVYHIADAFSIPTLVVFTTIPPELRISYYPTVEGVHLEGVRHTNHFGVSKTSGPRVMPEDLRNLWRQLDPARVVDQFLDLVGRSSK